MKRTFQLKNPVYIKSGFTIVGPKEGDGNYGDTFDIVLNNDVWYEKSYEKSECKMHRNAVYGGIIKSGLNIENIDIMLSGDLLNEITASNLSARNFSAAYFGLYNACSTFGEGILIGSMLIDGGFAENISCSTSSHFATAERQYRYPLELGNQRPPTSQWTVTGAGCTILSKNKPDSVNHLISLDKMFEDDCENCLDEKDKKRLSKIKYTQKKTINKEKSNVLNKSIDNIENDYQRLNDCYVMVTAGTIGKVIDLGVMDVCNMGAAMAPAAFDTIMTHFKNTNTNPEDYDAIFTGDLGRFGRQVMKHLMEREDIDFSKNYYDCGADYFKDSQKTFQGGSGTGCVNTCFNSTILKRLQKGELRKILVVPTGALLSKESPLQKETIPGIAHAFQVESEYYLK